MIPSFCAFADELEKIALTSGVTDFVSRHSGPISHGLDLAGLGILAKPGIDRLRGKHVDERKAAKTETAGLGVLALPSAVSLAHHAIKGMRKGASMFIKRSSYRPPIGSMKAGLLDFAHRAAQPHPIASKLPRAVSPSGRADMLQHFTQKAGGGKPRVGPGKPAIDLPPAPSGPMIIER